MMYRDSLCILLSFCSLTFLLITWLRWFGLPKGISAAQCILGLNQRQEFLKFHKEVSQQLESCMAKLLCIKAQLLSGESSDADLTSVTSRESSNPASPAFAMMTHVPTIMARETLDSPDPQGMKGFHHATKPPFSRATTSSQETPSSATYGYYDFPEGESSSPSFSQYEAPGEPSHLPNAPTTNNYSGVKRLNVSNQATSRAGSSLESFESNEKLIKEFITQTDDSMNSQVPFALRLKKSHQNEINHQQEFREIDYANGGDEGTTENDQTDQSKERRRILPPPSPPPTSRRESQDQAEGESHPISNQRVVDLRKVFARAYSNEDFVFRFADRRENPQEDDPDYSAYSNRLSLPERLEPPGYHGAENSESGRTSAHQHSNPHRHPSLIRTPELSELPHQESQDSRTGATSERRDSSSTTGSKAVESKTSNDDHFDTASSEIYFSQEGNFSLASPSGKESWLTAGLMKILRRSDRFTTIICSPNSFEEASPRLTRNRSQIVSQLPQICFVRNLVLLFEEEPVPQAGDSDRGSFVSQDISHQHSVRFLDSCQPRTSQHPFQWNPIVTRKVCSA